MQDHVKIRSSSGQVSSWSGQVRSIKIKSRKCQGKIMQIISRSGQVRSKSDQVSSCHVRSCQLKVSLDISGQVKSGLVTADYFKVRSG